jgi:hypothetical protein
MTSAVSIIQAAFREGNLIAVGVSPTTPEQNEALDKLNRLVRGLLGYKMGENLSDWLAPQPQRTAPVAANYPQAPLCNDATSNIYLYPPNNRRIVYGGTTLTVYLPQSPNPGSQMAVVQGSGAGDGGQVGDVLTLNGNGRTIEGAATQTFIFASPAFTPQRWFYRDDLADWVLVEDMELGDELPYPSEFDDFFICALSKRLAPAYGKIIAKETVETALRAESAFYARYRQPTEVVYGSEQIPRSYQSYIAGQWWW